MAGTLPDLVPDMLANPIEGVGSTLDQYIGRPISNVAGTSMPVMTVRSAFVPAVAGGVLGAVAQKAAGSADAEGCFFNVGQVGPIVDMTGLPPQVALSASVAAAVGGAMALFGMAGAETYGLVAGAVATVSPYLH